MKYIGMAAIILVFGIIFIPKIHNRIVNGSVVDNDRMSNIPQNYDDNVDADSNAKSITKTQGLTNEEIEILAGDQAALTKDDVAPLLTLQTVERFNFTNQNGKTITNDYYKGKVYVVEFFFTTCPSICPIMSQNMLKVQDAFSDIDDFGIASISIDPSHDTPAVLKEYADGYEVSHPHWNFLTGNKTEILDLSNNNFKLHAAEDEEEAGGFAHSGFFALVDKDGIVRSRKDAFGNPLFYYNGLEDSGIQMLVADIEKLLSENTIIKKPQD
ncbi:SCO family protein [Patiriisocius marinistellae]|nr:SCO family protein [Patiriisocius marinistellae]